MTLACAMFVLPASAQIRFGFKGGVQVTSLKVSNHLLDSENTAGFFMGPTAEFTLPIVGLGVDAAALYTQSGCKVKEGHEGSTEQSKSIELPVNLKWSFGLGSTLGVYLAAGPQFGFNIGEPDKYDSKKCVVSANLGGGIKLFRHFQVGANYNWGLSKLADFRDPITHNGIKVRKNGWNVSLAYMF